MNQEEIVERTSDELESWLTASERVISQIRSTQMVVLREVAARQLPLADGCRSMAEWVAGRLDMSPQSARQLASTSQRLAELPDVESASLDGSISYERTTAVARLATPSTQAEVLEDSGHLDINGVQRQAALLRQMTRADEREIAESEHVILRPNLDESRWDLWGSLGGYHGRVVEKALAQRGDDLPSPPNEMRPSVGRRQAEALVSICQDSFDGQRGAVSAAPLVTVFVEAKEATPSNGEVGVYLDNGTRVGPDTLERILCVGSVEVLGRTEYGKPLSFGEAGRTIPPKLKRFVIARDGGCCADGCSSTYKLQPHHTVPYAISKSHDAEELRTYCWWHHQVMIHQRGYTIDPTSPRGRTRFLPPDYGPP